MRGAYWLLAIAAAVDIAITSILAWFSYDNINHKA